MQLVVMVTVTVAAVVVSLVGMATVTLVVVVGTCMEVGCMHTVGVAVMCLPGSHKGMSHGLGNHSRPEALRLGRRIRTVEPGHMGRGRALA